MASCSFSCEDQILCSICFDVFKDPVTTPCGHNYCEPCITKYWDSSKQIRCPLCNKRFRHRPALKCNTSFRDIVEHLKGLSLSHSDELQAKPGDVACDICLSPKLKALKTCLVCQASYCQLHLEPHDRVSNLKKHKLTEPVLNLEAKVCKKHNKIFDMFCTVDKMCICYMCLKDDHASHGSVSLECAFSQEKAYIEGEMAELKRMENTKSRYMNQLRSSIQQSHKNKDADIADIDMVFTALVDLLQKHKVKLVEIIEQKHTEALKQPEDRVLQLLQEIIMSVQKRSELEQLIKTEDPLQLLLCKSTMHRSQHKDQLSSVSDFLVRGYDFDYDPIDDHSYSGLVKTAMDLMEKMLNNEMDRLIHKVQYSDDEDCNTTWIPPKDKLMMIQQNDTVDVTLDPYSAHPHLLVYEEGKAAMFGQLTNRHSFFRRFENQPFVVSIDGFASGRFYYEVQVCGSKQWLLGVVRENFNWEMSCIPHPTDGAWIISTLNRWYDVDQRPKKVGVFVDYEKGEVSFYDVDARSVIHSYTECMFNKPVSFLKSFLYGLAGVSVSNRAKLYPVFGVFFHLDYLKITPVEITF